MRKFLGIAVLCLSSAAFAEKSRTAAAPASHGFLQEHSLSVGVDTAASIPVGNYSDINGPGAGIYALGELALLDTVSATMRIGFEAHADRGLLQAHVHSLPILLGAKAWLGQERQGMFGSFEMGLFDLMSSATVNGQSASSNDLKFGMGAGLGYQQNRWNMRVSLYSHDVGNFGSAMMLTGGIGYSFGAL